LRYPLNKLISLASSGHFLIATLFCFGELYILQGSEVSMSNFVFLFDTWFLLAHYRFVPQLNEY
jgi:hypothetical protein